MNRRDLAMLFLASAPGQADLTLLVELALGVSLIAGAWAAHVGRIRLHKYVQSAVILVNIPIVLIAMVPHYLSLVAPVIPGQLAAWFNLLPTTMLVLGALAEGLGVYILLVAGTDWLPEQLRFRRYRLWMRSELVLWWAVLALGLSVYIVWYG